MNLITGFFARIFGSPEKKIILTIYDLNEPLTFQTLNETINFEGICLNPIKIGKTSLQLPNQSCSLKFYEPSGEMKITTNSVSYDLKSPMFEINGVIYNTEEKVSGKAIVTSGKFYIGIDKIKIDKINATLEIYTIDEKPSLIVKFPPCEYLEMNNFVGSLTIESGTIKLAGTVSGKYRCQNVENKI